MRIRTITPYLMQAGAPTETAWSAGGLSTSGSRHWCFVKVETDEGVYGIGEGSGWPKVVATAIADLAPSLIGEDAHNIDRLWHRMFTAQMGHGQTGVIGSGAIGAIDMALWDLNAKALNIPLHRLLGGKFRDRIRCYVHASSAETAKRAMDEGFNAVKTGNIRDAHTKAAEFRAMFGPELDIAVDLHGPPWLIAADAIRLAKSLEQHDLMFLEEPVAPEDLDGLRRVRAGTNIPLAAGERLSTLWGYKTLIGEGLVDIVQPDTGRVGGISQLRKIAAFAEAHFIQVAPHSGTLGPVAEFAAIHFLASIPNGLIHERFLTDWEGRQQILTHSLETRDGHMIVPERPGLGTDLILEEIAKHPPGVNIAGDSPKFLSGYEANTAEERIYTQPRRGRAQYFDTIAKGSQ
jgi:galactonate dehydratase